MKAYLVRSNNNIAIWPLNDSPVIHWTVGNHFILRGFNTPLIEIYSNEVSYLEKDLVGKMLGNNKMKEIEINEEYLKKINEVSY